MLRVLSGEAIAKLVILLSFFVCYSWIYHTMIRDEKSFKLQYAQRYQEIDRISQGLPTEEPASD